MGHFNCDVSESRRADLAHDHDFVVGNHAADLTGQVDYCRSMLGRR